MRYTAKLLAARVTTLIVGLMGNLSIASQIISKQGPSEYAYYAAITAIPMFLPFADLGLGTALLNKLATKPDKAGRDIELLSGAFFKVLNVLFLIVALAMIPLSYFHFWEFVYPGYSEASRNFYCSCIVAGTFLATPYSLAFRKLQYQKRILAIVTIQGFIPVISWALITAIFCLGFPSQLCTLCPTIAYLVTSIFAFFFSRIYRDFQFSTITASLRLSRNSFNLGLWSIALMIAAVGVLQLPRVLLLRTDRTDIALSYSFILMVLTPAMSLFSVLASAKVVDFLRIISYMEMLEFIKYQTYRLALPLFLMSAGSLFIPVVALKFGFSYLSFNHAFLILPIIIVASLTQFNLSIQTSKYFLKRNTINCTLILFFEISMFILRIPEEFFSFLYLVIFPAWILLTFLTFRNYTSNKHGIYYEISNK